MLIVKTLKELLKGRNKSRNIAMVDRRTFHKERPECTEWLYRGKKDEEEPSKMKQLPIKTSVCSWDGQRYSGILHDFLWTVRNLKGFWSRNKRPRVWKESESSSRKITALEDVQMGVITRASISSIILKELWQPWLSVSYKHSEKGGIIKSHCPKTPEWPWVSLLTPRKCHCFGGMGIKPNSEGLL